MYAFLILCIPLSVTVYCFFSKSFNYKSYIPPLTAGLVTGTICAIIREFFIFSTSTNIVYAVLPYFFSIFFKQFFIPIVLLTLIYNLFSINTGKYKANSTIPLLGAFYSIIVPYYGITAEENKSFFILFCLPVLVMSTLILLKHLLKKVYSFLEEKNYLKLSLFIVLSILTCCITPLLQTLWYFTSNGILYMSFTLIITLAVQAYNLYKIIKTHPAEPERIPIFMSM